VFFDRIVHVGPLPLAGLNGSTNHQLARERSRIAMALPGGGSGTTGLHCTGPQEISVVSRLVWPRRPASCGRIRRRWRIVLRSAGLNPKAARPSPGLNHFLVDVHRVGCELAWSRCSMPRAPGRQLHD